MDESYNSSMTALALWNPSVINFTNIFFKFYHYIYQVNKKQNVCIENLKMTFLQVKSRQG